MLQEAVDGLNIREGGTWVDVTFGGGGHSSEILRRFTEGRLFAFDQDEAAWNNAPDDKRFFLVKDNFRNITARLTENDAVPADGILADLGVSSHQFDEAGRGFSIRFDALLDMRMSQSAEITAKDILNTYSAEELSRVFREYGELFNARRIANAVIRARESAPVDTVQRLREILAFMAPRGKENSFYAQVFQALRIEVNDEMAALREFLNQVPNVLCKGGRLVVISYHSLEDRMVKNFINSGNTQGKIEKDFYGNVTGLVLKPLQRKPKEPSEKEVSENPRARSARMRIAEKI
jgi:16S rRNA (cytosine1402-N4)-methyltransferase